MEPKNRFGLPVQAGEFIHIQNGEAHILSYVEEWPDAPETTSGYRGVNLHGLYIGIQELRSTAISERGFSELESRFKQSICEEPIEQDVFDVWIDGSNVDETIFKPISTSEFLNGEMEDGCYFVIFARGTLYTGEICQIQSDWAEFKIQQKLAKPDASVAEQWAREWLDKHPELDAPWIEGDVMTTISCIEEPSEWKGEEHPFVGKRIRIVSMEGEPAYAGREGVVESVDDAGQLHGTWGGCAVVPGTDDYVFVTEPEKPKYLTVDEILDVIRSLSRSQGRWGRLLEEILESKEGDPDKYAEWAKGMEAKNFADALEVVLFFEEGKLPKACPKTKYWSVPVVYEMYGSISVEASSAEEAYDKVKNHPEDFDLPDEGFYVDDSFRVADDDRENAIESIRELDCPYESNPAEDGAASGRHTGLTVKATVTFQRWDGDYARFNGEAEFDACDALDSMDDDEIAEIERGEPYALDEVYRTAVRLGQIHDYDGPFEVDLDEDNLSDYLEARKKGQ